MNEARTQRRYLPRLLIFGLTALAGGGCDLQTKTWAEQTLGALPDRSMMVVDPWLELALAYNKGTAFSFVRDLGDARILFGLIAMLVVVFLLIMALRSRGDTLELLALGTIAGGAIGNGLDRAIHLTPGGGTGVVDFIKFNYPASWPVDGYWPIFNVADVLIAIGVGMLLLYGFIKRKEGDPDRTSPPAPATVAA